METTVYVCFRGDGAAEGATQYTGPDRRTGETERTAEERVQAEIVDHVRDALQRGLQGGGVTHFVYQRAPDGARDDDHFRESTMNTAVCDAAIQIAGEVTSIHREGEAEEE